MSEACQRSFDLASLYENMRVARGDLAAVKVQYFLALEGIKGFEHPNQWKRLVAEKRRYLNALMRMAKACEDNNDAIPEPETLEVVGSKHNTPPDPPNDND